MENRARSKFIDEISKVECTDAELDIIMEKTHYYSARDYDNFVREIRAKYD